MGKKEPFRMDPMEVRPAEKGGPDIKNFKKKRYIILKLIV